MGPVLLQLKTGVPGEKPAMFGRVKLDNTLLTCDKGNFNQITAKSQNRTPVVIHLCSSTVPLAPTNIDIIGLLSLPSRRPV